MTIPLPEGFAVVTSKMEALDSFFESLVPQTNKRLLSLVSIEAAEAPAEEQFNILDQTLGVQTMKKGLTETLSSAEFAKLKEGVKNDSSRTFATVKKKIGALTDEIAENLEENFKTKLDLKIGEIVPLPAHYEADRAISYSMLAKTSVKAKGKQEPVETKSITTVTMVHVKARVLFLYVAGTEADMEWTRRVAREWSKAIIKANPSDAATAQLEAAPAKRAGDSGTQGGIIGGVAGVLIALYLRSRTKSGDK